MTDKELSDALNLWFDTVDKGNPNLFTRNPVAATLKNRLDLWGNWKGKPRGIIVSLVNSQKNEVSLPNSQQSNVSLINSQGEEGCELSKITANTEEKQNEKDVSLVNSQLVTPKKTNPFKYKYSEPYIYAEKSIGIIESKLPYRIKKHYEQEKKESGLDLPKHFWDNLDEIIFNEKQDGKFILSQNDADFWSDLQVIKNKILEDLEKEELE